MNGFLISVAIAVGAATSIQLQAREVEASLHAERPEYYVGETVRLDLLVGNSGSDSVHGYFALRPWLNHETGSRLEYCRGDDCREFALPDPVGAYVLRRIETAELKPGRSVRSHSRVAWDHGLGSFVLREPGTYEFRWTSGVYPGPAGGSDGQLDRLVATTQVKVLPVPPSETVALQAYSHGHLAVRAQQDAWRYSAASAADVEVLIGFLKEHPRSIYAEGLRAGAGALLADLLRKGSLPERHLEFAREYLR